MHHHDDVVYGLGHKNDPNAQGDVDLHITLTCKPWFEIGWLVKIVAWQPRCQSIVIAIEVSVDSTGVLSSTSADS